MEVDLNWFYEKSPLASNSKCERMKDDDDGEVHSFGRIALTNNRNNNARVKHVSPL